jgi:protein-L-isoaspartate(D-aspartate) O-methyltransferase
MNLDLARHNMIEQQLRTWEVLDARVLEAVEALPREQFVPREFRRLAYSDCRIPLPCGQVMMAPKVEARMLQLLAIQPGDRVLEIGTGSGYVTALIARLGGEVTSVEYHEALSHAARAKLKDEGIDAELIVGDGLHGWRDGAPYDVIAVTGSIAEYDTAIGEQLNAGGRLFVVCGRSPVMKATLIERVDDTAWSKEAVFETDLPALIGVPEPDRFEF